MEEETIQKFKHEKIYPNIVKGEIEDHNMAIWLEKLAMHSYEPSDDVNTEAEAPGDDDDDDEVDDEECDKGDKHERRKIYKLASENDESAKVDVSSRDGKDDQMESAKKESNNDDNVNEVDAGGNNIKVNDDVSDDKGNGGNNDDDESDKARVAS